MQQPVAADAPGAERTPHVVARHADRRIVLRMTTEDVDAGVDQIARERRGVRKQQHHELDGLSLGRELALDHLVAVHVGILAERRFRC